jgi:hypothetical protein
VHVIPKGTLVAQESHKRYIHYSPVPEASGYRNMTGLDWSCILR